MPIDRTLLISIARVPSPVGRQIAFWLVAMGSTWNLVRERNPKGSTCATASENALRISTPRKLTGLYRHGTLRASRRRFLSGFSVRFAGTLRALSISCMSTQGTCIGASRPIGLWEDLYRASGRRNGGPPVLANPQHPACVTHP